MATVLMIALKADVRKNDNIIITVTSEQHETGSGKSRRAFFEQPARVTRSQTLKRLLIGTTGKETEKNDF